MFRVRSLELLRFWRTVRHLRPVQVYGRLWFRLARVRPNFSKAPRLRTLSGRWVLPAYRQSGLTGPGNFRFLNEDGSLVSNGWDDSSKAKLWRYNQHYFDYLNAEGTAERLQWHRELIADWIAANAPGQGTGWEPYPTSLRIVNWVKWVLAGNSLDSAAVQSLAIQTRWLCRRLEWHLLGNHLLSNAKALVFAGLWFDGPEAASWLAKGVRILARELPEQILLDGGHFELSPMYHALACDDFLDLVNIARAFGRNDLAQRWSTPLPAMLDWLASMTHPDGAPAFFNDTAIGIAPTTDQVFAYAENLGFSRPVLPVGTRFLAASGYARLECGPVVVIADLADIGPDYLPGHAHADTLSFELSLHRDRIIVNSGTSVYGLGPERVRQRGTAAHSTLMIDGRNSTEVWSGFRVGRRARPFRVKVSCNNGLLLAEGAHNGYEHLPGAPLHHRTWRLTRNGLLVTDSLEGGGEHQIEARFHLAPKYRAVVGSDGVVYVMREPDQQIVLYLVTAGATPSVQSSSWHPEFGLRLPNQVICLRADANFPAIITTYFQWAD